MNLPPILAALRKHKAGVVLIALQIALTLAIVCNAVFIIGQRIERVNRPTGLDESNLFVVNQQWVGAPSTDEAGGVDKLDAMLREDIVALRQLPSVQSVSSINSIPLLNSSWNGALALQPGQEMRKGVTRTTYYFGDEQMFATLGIRVVEGRAFTAGDIEHRGFRDTKSPSIVMVTKAIADKLYPGGSAVGKVVYIDGGSTPSTIVGVVERMQVPNAGTWTNSFAYNATLVPTRLNSNFSRYAIRSKPGQLDAAMKAAAPALYKVNPMRVLDDQDGVRAFGDLRQKAYEGDRGMAILMSMVCLILLCVTAAGIVGLTSFWVGQRQRQIGVRRALGARKVDILRYFQLENLLIAGIGTVLGIALAVGLNLWLISSFEMDRLPVLYILMGTVVVLVLGQAAVFVPARRASLVPPVVATRSV